MINFPTSIDSFPNPTSTDLMENATTALDHDQQHSNANDAIEALEAKVGINSSAVTTSHDYKLGEVTSSDKAVGKTATQTLTNKTLTSPQINFGSDANGDIIIRNGSGVTSRLAAGTSGQILNVDAGTGLPAWVSNPSTSDATTSVKGVVELATAAEINAGTATGGTGAALVVTPDQLLASNYAIKKFGGTGADGALALTSGATNIDLGGAQVFTKNYTSISITGTGYLTFTNPHANGTIVILKSQGDVTITTSATRAIDMRSIGAAGVAQNTAGKIGTSLVTQMTAPAAGDTSSAKAGGTGIGYGNLSIVNKSLVLFCGGSGGGGETSSNATPSGAGGGCLYIECAGAWNVTGTIDLSGTAGATNTTNPGGNRNGSGGGGGASFNSGGTSGYITGASIYGSAGGGGGGVFIGLYNTLTANSGTYTITGGAGGTGGGFSAGGGAGGDGYSLVKLNTEFV